MKFKSSELASNTAISVVIDKARKDLYLYTKLMWPILEPGREFIPGWHIEAICKHLEAITNDEIRNLLINIPPGHMKSLLTCVIWPSWVWLRKPERRFIFGSYAETLSIRDSVKCRDVIRSDRYQDLFRPDWQLKDDQDQKKRFNNSATGYRIATSVGGSGTGERADIIVCDDPLNAINAESEAYREAANQWWFETMSTRDSDSKTSKRVVIMQRLHEKDLSGEIIKRGGYEHLCLPAEFEPARKSKTKIGWEDPRTEEKELLWPKHLGSDQIHTFKTNLGSRGYANQFQQRPAPQDGGLIKRKWFKFYKNPPGLSSIKRVVQFWDTAQKPGLTNDYSVCATYQETTSGYYLLDITRMKFEYPQLKQSVKNMAAKYSPNAILIEDKSSGISLIQDLRQESSLPIIAFNPGQRDKQIRAAAATPIIESGNLLLPESAKWVEDFILEHEHFPNGEHDDQVDTTSMMADFFSKNNKSEPRIRSL